MEVCVAMMIAYISTACSHSGPYSVRMNCGKTASVKTYAFGFNRFVSAPRRNVASPRHARKDHGEAERRHRHMPDAAGDDAGDGGEAGAAAAGEGAGQDEGHVQSRQRHDAGDEEEEEPERGDVSHGRRHMANAGDLCPNFLVITNVLAMLELLQTHGQLSGADLARRLGAHAPTVRRYGTALEALGIPLVAERGRPGAYGLVAGFKLPPMMFTDDEALALSIGLLAARGLGLAGAAPAVASAQAKLERVMPPSLERRLRAVGETVQLDLARPSSPAGGAAPPARTA